jgi:hypothetical protein
MTPPCSAIRFLEVCDPSQRLLRGRGLGETIRRLPAGCRLVYWVIPDSHVGMLGSLRRGE